MKSMLTAGMMAMVSATGTQAACKTDLITVTKWSITPIDKDFNKLTVELTSSASKPIRMIDGKFRFDDPLDGQIASASIDRDVQIEPGGKYEQVGAWGRFTFERLLELKPEEVTAKTCVRAVLYDDGTKEEFK